MCGCIQHIDELLKPHNTRLGLTLMFVGDPLPSIVTEQLEKGRGKPRAKAMIPSFCPFCGEKYPARSNQGDSNE
jgi:hypothetical protein